MRKANKFRLPPNTTYKCFAPLVLFRRLTSLLQADLLRCRGHGAAAAEDRQELREHCQEGGAHPREPCGQEEAQGRPGQRGLELRLHGK